MGSVYRLNIINPNYEFLGYITAIANIQDKHDRSAPSNYHWKILKCRMIIFSHSSVLACPDKTDIEQVHIIFNKRGDGFEKLNSLFSKFSLLQDGPIKNVTSETFQMCFRYTLTAKLAPVYNVIGYNYLVNNRNFLVTEGRQDGIKINIWCNDRITTLEIQPIKIQLIRPDDELKFGDLVRVLPSLNKAVIEEYYEQLPEGGAFKCYKDLRRHWKNIHGYRLPEEECPYYAVRFWRGEPLTYPKICVVQNYPIVMPLSKTNEKSLLMTFLNCLKQRMAHILGSPLKFEGNHSYQEITYHDKVTETQMVSLCTPTQNLQPENS